MSNAYKTILIIDDDKDIVETIKGNLTLDGYKVIFSHLGHEGIEMVKTHQPDLILLDLTLPDMDGILICEILRKSFDSPIIMLTARDTLSDKVLGLKSGADDYIVKPFEYLELSARITAIFNRIDRSLVKEKQGFKHLEINYKTRQVLIREQIVKLTKTEFQLLELFVCHPDKSLSREFIEKQIWWDSQLYSHSRALDVHIQRLRKKIEEHPETPTLIVTISGVGYKFNSR
ncbi:MAG: response regulator transcription factor [Proteobacteria bacterium]|nr:response regulator transcription factor [Pseudomonadota bacterium]MBU1581815.1 response regulator transcription factor [Pseudomonadota bacterium]MBU2454717.1 response regulator transcription factor [Pseudomonadota bacterium]MBU2627751.1 response regulator transcription factor [Pseudomonadota bacterium]